MASLSHHLDTPTPPRHREQNASMQAMASLSYHLDTPTPLPNVPNMPSPPPPPPRRFQNQQVSRLLVAGMHVVEVSVLAGPKPKRTLSLPPPPTESKNFMNDVMAPVS